MLSQACYYEISALRRRWGYCTWVVVAMEMERSSYGMVRAKGFDWCWEQSCIQGIIRAAHSEVSLFVKTSRLSHSNKSQLEILTHRWDDDSIRLNLGNIWKSRCDWLFYWTVAPGNIIFLWWKIVKGRSGGSRVAGGVQKRKNRESCFLMLFKDSAINCSAESTVEKCGLFITFTTYFHTQRLATPSLLPCPWVPADR